MAGRVVLTITQLSATSHFTNDLGLDSLDTVEVVMAIEEVRLVTRARYMRLLMIATGVQHRDPGQGGGRHPQREPGDRLHYGAARR